MDKEFILFLLAASISFFGCTGPGSSSCEVALENITRELGSSPRDSIWLPLVDTTRDFFCDTALIDSLRTKWNFKDSTTVFVGKQINVIRIISDGPYQAKISIFNKQNFEVRSFVQYFGIQKIDSCHVRPGRKLSFLVWDMRDKNNEEVADGVYNWKITFNGFFGGYSTSMKTGVVLKSCENGIE